jgi:deoxyribose-phosphate aldolase
MEGETPRPFDRRLAAIIDQTIMRPETRPGEIVEECRVARQYGFACFYVNPVHVGLAAARLQGSGVKVGTGVGFPFGALSGLTKALETREAIACGADEIDMVINLGAAREGDYETVEREIELVRRAAEPKPLKVLLETAYLDREQIVRLCRVAQRLGAAFVKTSSGFAPAGATVEHVRLMRQTVGPDMGVKAAGGLRTREFALQLLEAGANRLGTSRGAELVSLPAEAGGPCG